MLEKPVLTILFRLSLATLLTFCFAGCSPRIIGASKKAIGLIPNQDQVAPSLLSVTPPANSTYVTGMNVDFVALFSEAVTVSGSRISLDIGGVPRYATYVSGSGTTTITYRYIVTLGHIDADGIEMSSPIELNGGSVQDASGNSSTLSFTVPNTSGILIDGSVPDTTSPTITSVTPPSNAWYRATANLDFVVNFDENVTVSGTPRLELDIGGSTVYATYQSGSGGSALTFRYTVATGNLDTNGIATVSPLGLNGGTLRDAASNNATLTYTLPNTAGVLVDAVVPTISSVTPPADTTYVFGSNLDFVVNFSENVTLSNTTVGDAAGSRLEITVGAATRYATYLSGSGTNAVTYRYTPTSQDADANGIAVVSPLLAGTSTIRDPAGNDATLTFVAPNTTNVLVDATQPTISSITVPSSNVYITGEDLDFTVNFSETVTLSSTNSRLAITIGSTTRYATYVSGSGGTAILYRYTIVSADLDSNGIAMTSPLDANGDTILDGVNNSAILTFTAPTTSGIIVNYFDFAGGNIEVVVPANDGSGDIYVGGSFTSYAGVSANRIIRLNSNLKRDTAFSIGSGFNGSVDTILPSNDGTGDIWVGGNFTQYVNGATYNESRLIRLHNDGSVDTTFTTNSSGCTAQVLALSEAVDDSGDLYVGGSFGQCNGSAAGAYNRIVRYNRNGTIDGAFVPGTWVANNFMKIRPVQDGTGDILATGWFNTYQGVTNESVVRIRPDGSIATDFNTLFDGLDASSGNYFASSFDYLSNGDIFVAGTFSRYNTSTAISNAVRLNVDGSNDATFVQTGAPTYGFAGGNFRTWDVAVALDGTDQVYYSGEFSTFRGTSVAPNLARISSTGTRDATFAVGTGFDGSVRSIALANDTAGTIWAAGAFNNFNGLAASKLKKISTVASGTVPIVLSVDTVNVDGSYDDAATIDIEVTFSENVTVNTGGGVPSILLETGTTDRTAVYDSGSGSDKLIFRYTVQSGDESLDLSYQTWAPFIRLNGGTISNATNNATLLLPYPGMPGSLRANAAIVVVD